MSTSIVDNVCLPVSSAYSVRPPFSVTNGVRGVLEAYGKLGVADPDAVIKALFANNKLGAWYDPSDLSTMFRDRTGTTPVTADGQTVGLILDKSKGLVLGSELVTNGTFDSDISGWDSYSGFDPTLMEWSAGRLHVITGATRALFGESAASASAITIGKWYKAELDLTVVSGNSPTIGFNVSYYGGQCFVISGTKTSGTYHVTGIFNAAFGGNCHVTFDSQETGACEIYVDNVSVKEIAGNHAVAPSDAARPLKTSTGLAKWINYDAVDDVLNTTFAASLGASCTVGRANVGSAATILTAQTIGTSYADSTDNAGLIIVNLALTTQETTDLTAWLTAKGATA